MEKLKFLSKTFDALNRELENWEKFGVLSVLLLVIASSCAVGFKVSQFYESTERNKLESKHNLELAELKGNNEKPNASNKRVKVLELTGISSSADTTHNSILGMVASVLEDEGASRKQSAAIADYAIVHWRGSELKSDVNNFRMRVAPVVPSIQLSGFVFRIRRADTSVFIQQLQVFGESASERGIEVPECSEGDSIQLLIRIEIGKGTLPPIVKDLVKITVD